MNDKPASIRVRQATAFALGAVVYLLWTGVDGERFRWTPFVIGLVYLTAAAVGGRRGGHWATACVLTGWGLSVLLFDQLRPGSGEGLFYAAGLLAGAATAAVLSTRRFSAAPAGIIGTVAGAIVFLALEPQVDLLAKTTLYASLLGAVAAVNFGLALRRA